MSNNIVVIGSSNTDMIIKLPRIPAPGETVLGGTFATAPGGKGANQAVAAARAQADVTFIARVGMDMFGDNALAGFMTDGIDAKHVIRDKSAPSGVASIFVDENAQNSIAVASGANMNLSPADIQRASAKIASADIILTQLEIPLETVIAAAQIAAQHEVPVILNPAPAQPLTDELYKNIAIITPNEIEAQMLTGIEITDDQSASKAAQYFHDKSIPTVIITLGANGAYLSDESVSGIIPAFKVTPIDTTAAGDVFNGTLAMALANEKEITQAITFANAAAAISTTKLGAQTSAPTLPQIENFLENHHTG